MRIRTPFAKLLHHPDHAVVGDAGVVDLEQRLRLSETREPLPGVLRAHDEIGRGRTELRARVGFEQREHVATPAGSWSGHQLRLFKSLDVALKPSTYSDARSITSSLPW